MKLLLVVLAAVGMWFLAIGNDLVKEEALTRLDGLPRLIVLRAARRLRGVRQQERLQEWLGELDYICYETRGKPATRCFRGLRFAVGVWRSARLVAYADRGASAALHPRVALTRRIGRAVLRAVAVALILGVEFAAYGALARPDRGLASHLGEGAIVAIMLLVAMLVESVSRRWLAAGLSPALGLFLLVAADKPTASSLQRLAWFVVGLAVLVAVTTRWLSRPGRRRVMTAVAAHLLLATFAAIEPWKAPLLGSSDTTFGPTAMSYLLLGAMIGVLLVLGAPPQTAVPAPARQSRRDPARGHGGPVPPLPATEPHRGPVERDPAAPDQPPAGLDNAAGVSTAGAPDWTDE